MDSQPERVTMRAPDGGTVHVLTRDRAKFEADGYEFMYVDRVADEAQAAPTDGVAVDAAALVTAPERVQAPFVQPDRKGSAKKKPTT